MKVWWLTEFLNNFVLNVNWSFINANFDKFGWKFVLGQPYKVAFHAQKDIFANLKWKLIQNFRDNKVSKGILDILKTVL